MEGGLGFVNNKPTYKLFLLEPKKAPALAGYGIWCSHYFKQLDNVSKKSWLTHTLQCCVLNFLYVQYMDLCELIHVLKAVAIVTSEHLNLSTIFEVSHALFDC